MLIQGYDDKYGTMRQLDSISSQIKYNPLRLEIKNCGHSPHIEYPQLVLDNIQKFINSYWDDTEGRLAKAIATSLSS